MPAPVHSCERESVCLDMDGERKQRSRLADRTALLDTMHLLKEFSEARLSFLKAGSLEGLVIDWTSGYPRASTMRSAR